MATDLPNDDALRALGFPERLREPFAVHAAVGLTAARVARVDRGAVLALTGDGVVLAEPSPRLRKEAADAQSLPAVGDWVALRFEEGLDAAQVEAVLPRSSAFVRADPGKATGPQVLAANVDALLVVHAASTEPNLRRIERELALAWESGAAPVVVLTKADLCPEAQAAAAIVEAIAFGVPVHLVSGVTGEGVGDIAAYGHGDRTLALLGPSGVGKSTLVNHLLGEDVQATREVRASDGKGRHTTVARELIALPEGGWVIDSPGMRALALWDAEEGVAAAFPDIEALAPDCRFRDCGHETEPGCAVRAAVDAGTVPERRLESYHALQRELVHLAAKQDAHLRADEKRQGKAIAKASREFFKRRGGA